MFLWWRSLPLLLVPAWCSCLCSCSFALSLSSVVAAASVAGVLASVLCLCGLPVVSRPVLAAALAACFAFSDSLCLLSFVVASSWPVLLFCSVAVSPPCAAAVARAAAAAAAAAGLCLCVVVAAALFLSSCVWCCPCLCCWASWSPLIHCWTKYYPLCPVGIMEGVIWVPTQTLCCQE